MLVFVTGATGFIGRAVVIELLENGHQVLGLARSDVNVEILTHAGAHPHRGDLEDIESLKRGAKEADGVIHLAYIRDLNSTTRAMEVDRAAIAAMGEAMTGTGKPFVLASVTMGLPKGKLAAEDTKPDRNSAFSDRVRSADLVYTLSKEKGIRGSVVRLPPIVHGAGDKGIIPRLIDLSRQKGSVTYIDNGSARWPAVHRLDAAVLFRLVLERGTAGAFYNAVAEQGVPMKSIMMMVVKHLQLPVEGKSLDEAVGAMGLLAHIVGSDNPTSSKVTQRELGWRPTNPTFLADMEVNYFLPKELSKYSS